MPLGPLMTPITADVAAGKRVLLLGAGKDMLALTPRLLASTPAEVHLIECNPDAAAAMMSSDVRLTSHFSSVSEAPPADVAVRSPGFPRYSAAIVARLKAGMLVVSPIGLWLAERGPLPSFGVTGTKGKSSTTALIVQALAALGHDALALGNIGIPPWTEPPATERIPVLEISSYQAVDLEVAPLYAVLTSLGEDHVDWHGTVDQYYRDKARLFLAPTLSAERWMGVLDDVVLPTPFSQVPFTLVPAPEQPGIKWRNARLAAAAALAFAGEESRGPNADKLTAELMFRYPNLPGRLADIGTCRGIRFVDDSLASNPTGTAASVADTSGPVTAILGGRDRGASIAPLLRVAGARSGELRLVCICDASSWVSRLKQAGCQVEVAVSLEEAVIRAFAMTPRGGTVLFSPGMPTPANEGSWESRSARFRGQLGLVCSQENVN